MYSVQTSEQLGPTHTKLEDDRSSRFTIAAVLKPLASIAAQERFWTMLHLRPRFLVVDLAITLDLAAAWVLGSGFLFVFGIFNIRSTVGVGGTASRVERQSSSASDSPMSCCTSSMIHSLSLGGEVVSLLLKEGV